MKDVLLTPRLCRAARALLDWQQKDLAGYADLSLTAIKAFEKETGKTRPTTKALLQVTFEKHGIEFLSSGGLRPVEEIASIARFSGPTFMQKMYEDLYQACSQNDEEILTSSIDQTMWWQPDVAKLNDEFTLWATQNKKKMRTIMAKGDKATAIPLARYRNQAIRWRFGGTQDAINAVVVRTFNAHKSFGHGLLQTIKRRSSSYKSVSAKM